MSQDNLIKHSLATEAIMRSLARHLDKDEELWGITGLLHDIDLEETRDDQSRHALLGAEILRGEDFPKEGIQAVIAHNGEVLGVERKSALDFALASAETLTGLIIATALIYPDKKLASVKAKSVKKRMKEKRFAQNVNREIIKECENIDLELGEFIGIGLESMQQIAPELGL